MRLRIGMVLCLFFVICANTANAQVVDVRINKIAAGAPGSYWPFELDGDMNTREWIAMRVTEDDIFENKVAIMRGGVLCQGPWFNPWDAINPREFTVGTIMQAVGPIYRFVAQGASFYYEMSYSLPNCENGTSSGDNNAFPDLDRSKYELIPNYFIYNPLGQRPLFIFLGF